jgi:hypothetical protein
MHVLKTLLLAMLGTVGIYGLGAPTSAQAAPPSSSTVTFTDIGLVTHCNGFDALAHYEVRLTETFFFDKNGVPTRLQFHGVAFGTIRNSQTGYSLKDAPSVRNGFIDFKSGSATFVGVDFHVTVPGAGVVLLQSGRIVFPGPDAPPTFIAGPHLGPPDAMNAAICAALSH